jgi:hypothetical protein
LKKKYLIFSAAKSNKNEVFIIWLSVDFVHGIAGGVQGGLPFLQWKAFLIVWKIIFLILGIILGRGKYWAFIFNRSGIPMGIIKPTVASWNSGNIGCCKKFNYSW